MSDSISCAETAKLIRTALKRAFPSVKFSIRSKVYSMGASISINWTDGPTHDQVDAIAGRYQGASFDGMIDLKTYNTHFLMPDGSVAFASTPGTEGCRGTIAKEHNFKPHPEARRVHFGADYVFCNRHESEAFLGAVRAAWRALSEDERDSLMNKTHAWRAARPCPDRWRYDDELSDFGREADSVFRSLARQIAS